MTAKFASAMTTTNVAIDKDMKREPTNVGSDVDSEDQVSLSKSRLILASDFSRPQ